MRKYLKGAFLVLGICMVLGGKRTEVMAQTIREVEPNNSMEEAQEVKSNGKTELDFLKGNNEKENGCVGDIKKGDEDWYKVYLSSEEESYFTLIFSGTVCVDIYDESGQPVLSETAMARSSDDRVVYDVGISGSGLYYIHLSSQSKVSNRYTFLIGNPMYKAASTKMKAGAISLSPQAPQKTVEYVVTDNGVHERGKVYQISIQGMNYSNVSKIDMSYADSDSVITKSSVGAMASIKVPIDYNYGLDKKYFVTYYYGSSTRSFSPQYILYYVYPVLD